MIPISPADRSLPSLHMCSNRSQTMAVDTMNEGRLMIESKSDEKMMVDDVDCVYEKIVEHGSLKAAMKTDRVTESDKNLETMISRSVLGEDSSPYKYDPSNYRTHHEHTAKLAQGLEFTRVEVNALVSNTSKWMPYQPESIISSIEEKSRFINDDHTMLFPKMARGTNDDNILRIPAELTSEAFGLADKSVNATMKEDTCINPGRNRSLILQVFTGDLDPT